MTQRPIDPESLQQTKQEIRNLARDIAELSKQELSPPEYFEKFLQGVVTALAAVGGAVWTLDGGRLSLLYQINLRTTELLEDGEDQMRHGRLIQRVVQTGEPLVVPPYSGPGDAGDVGNPTRFLLILLPLKSENEVEGVVEIFQRPGASPDVQRGYLRFMTSVCDLANGWIKSRKLRQISDKQTLWQRLEQFAQVVHESLDRKETAFVIANETQRFVGCDRVTVIVRKRGKFFVEAISGQDQIDTRSNMVTLLQALVRRVLAAGDPLWHTGDTVDLPPQIEESLEDYVDQAHTKTIAIVPLRRPDRPIVAQPEDEEQEAVETGEILGALVVEQIEDNTDTAALKMRTTLAQGHAARAIANADDYSSLFLMPLWRLLGKSRWLFQAKTLPKTVAAVVAVTVAVAAAVLVPVDFNLKGKGVLQPVARHDVFAGVEGVVTEVHHEHGDQVDKGDPLVTLRNTDLMVQMKNTEGQRQTALERKLSLERALLDSSRISADERSRLASDLLQVREQIESLKAQYTLLQEKERLLTVRSPIAGQLITWDPKKLLMNRPVAPGQVLLTVVDPTSEWELLVYMPEDNVGYVMDAVHKRGDSALPVDYVLATNPGHSLTGHVKQLHQRAEAHEEDGHSVKIAVTIDRDDLDDPRPGATATAKLHCGKRAFAFVWLHDVVEFLQTRLFF
ncbi:MAG: HlyD family efflux transporter periplasmic adaptor subunit [Planctomycetales bacterium]|nr:HlyD family efflux transporter periplasmic adaptor subunit [Planctomycetales bacterium]